MKKKEKKQNKKFTIYKLFGTLLIISSLILLGMVLYINVLPLKYLCILLGVLLFINLVFNFFLFRKKVKKKPKKIFSVLSVIFTIIFLLGSYYIYKTFGVLEDMSKEYQTYTYHVLVRNESTYNEIKDIDGKTLGYYNTNSEALKKALEKVKTQVNAEEETFGNLDGLATGLLNEATEAILVEDSQKNLLEKAGNNENTSLSDFTGKTRVIYTFKIQAKPESKTVNVTKDVFNVYISGMDEYGKVSEVSRSDVNMILTINPKTKQILLTNIPRDYYVQLHDTTGYKDKLTHAGIYGVETSIKTLEDLLGIEINYYFKVNFSSLQNIVNALDGVDVYSEYDFQSWNGYNFTKGYNHVEGKAALAFARERHTFTDGDNQRGKNQQALIEAIFRKCTSPDIIIKYNSLLNSLKDSMITNMSTKSMMSLAKMQLKDNAKWSITSNSVKGTGSSEPTYTYPYQNLYVMIPDETTLKDATELITKVANGEKLESSYNEESSNVHSVTKSYVAPKVTTTTTTKKNKTKKQTTKKSTTTKKNTTTKKETTKTPKDDTKDDVKDENSDTNDNITPSDDNQKPAEPSTPQDPITPAEPPQE